MLELLEEFLEFYKKFAAGECKADSVDVLKDIVRYRTSIMKRANSLRDEYAAISCVFETLYKRAAGCHTVLRPCDFLYMGLTEANGKTVENCKEARDKFVRLTGIVKYEETIDKLLPLTSMAQVDEAIETLMVLAQVVKGELSPPGPATPPPDN